jgi:CPA1 family monovalent cation:H+ antiporter
MNLFDIAAVLILIAAASGYINHRLLKLPATSGTLIVALAGALGVVALDAVAPTWHLQAGLVRFLDEIDFNQTLMHGMLCFLLFAGALHVDDSLFENKGTIAALATVGILVRPRRGRPDVGMFRLMGVEAPFVVCLVFGALISPTDRLRDGPPQGAARATESRGADRGESLFNDGIAVVVFLGLVSVAGLSAVLSRSRSLSALQVWRPSSWGGGRRARRAAGYVSYRALKASTTSARTADHARARHVPVRCPSGSMCQGPSPCRGRPPHRQSGPEVRDEPEHTRHIDAFWNMVDEILNAVLFLLLGLQVFAVPAGARPWSQRPVVPIALIARFVSVGVPVSALGFRSRPVRGLVPVLTWSGLRGGISVALVMSLPRFPARDYLLPCTYAVVVFSVLAQGLTVWRVLLHYRIGAQDDRSA